MQQKEQSKNTNALFIIGILFFSFGFITWLNGTLIPFLKIACELKTDIQAFFVTFAFYMAYFFLSLPASYILQKTGYKNGMALGLLIIAIGSMLFIPAAKTRSFPFFLIGLFIQGTGLALLQTASNPYISILGPIKSAAKRISIMGICNKVAGALSPLILSSIVLKNTKALEAQIKLTTNPEERNILLNNLAERIINPYCVIAAVLILLAIIIRRSSLPEIEMGTEEQATGTVKKTSVFQFPYLLLGVLCIFLYVGVEVMAGDAIGAYGRSMGMSVDDTKYFTTFTLIAMLVGYIVGIFTIPKIISQEKSLTISAIIGIIFTTIVYFTVGKISIVFIALLGLANALMWPAIFPLAIEGLGKFTKTGSALLVMGIAGGAVIPLIYGSLMPKNVLGNGPAFFVCMIPCYIYILFYSLKGHLIGKRQTKEEATIISLQPALES